MVSTLPTHGSRQNMFQTFDTQSNPANAAERLAELRNMFGQIAIDGFIIPRADRHLGEYISADAQRLAWLTGFTGSAGCAVVLADKAAIFVDGRYTLQAAEQVDTAIYEQQSLIDNPPAKWLRANIDAGMKIGFDPWLHSITEAKALAKSLASADGTLVAVERNLVDQIWQDRPAPPLGAVKIHPLQYAGITAAEKIAALCTTIKKAGADCCLLSDPASIAWTFNIRGSDVLHAPLALCFAIIHTDKRPQLFIDKRKIEGKTATYLDQLADILKPADLETAIADITNSDLALMLDPALSAEKFALIVGNNGGKIVEGKDPARLPRAIKNSTEIEGSRAAHLRDGAAFAEFLYWFAQQPAGSLDEITVTKKLETCRRNYGQQHQMPLRDISFDTICGSGPNGAIIHYRVDDRSNQVLNEGELLLLDSGGQYEDGTTDITRTIAIGTPTSAMRRHHTLVLKGHVDIALARFPTGTRGVDIDVLARTALWQQGLDYAHGTGHGVGSYLSVHEGPQNISRRGMHELHAGMIISNEPGYYKPGEYGIRIENLVLVRGPDDIDGGDIQMLGFETLTLAPFDQRLIDAQLLSDPQLHWLNAYHGHVRRQLVPLVNDEVGKWLTSACEPISRILPAASA